MKVLVTGANGFLGTHLVKCLTEMPNIDVLTYTRNDVPNSLYSKLVKADFIFHLAGVNRPKHNDEFFFSNIQLTSDITNFLCKHKIKSSIYFSSSVHADNLSNYGISKRRAEILIEDLSRKNGNKVFNVRLVGVFGPGGIPFYNSVVATFCKQIVCGENLLIFDPDKIIQLLYIDDLIESLRRTLLNQELMPYKPVNSISLKNLSSVITSFRDGAEVEININEYFLKCLKETYESYLPSIT